MREARFGDAVLHLGDCREVLASMPAESVHAVVTDPPYHLTTGKKGGSGEASVNLESPYGRARVGTGFMGMKWDGGDIAHDPALWREVLRVLKPGGHLLAFAGTRTYHRLACAIEDAGFELRDMVAWVYGSGFPKNLDVARAIDTARTEDVEPTRAICRFLRAAMDAKGLKSTDLVRHFGGCDARLIDHWAARDTDSQPNLPTREQWEKLREVLELTGEMDEEFDRLDARKGERSDTYKAAPIIGEREGATPGFVGQRFARVDATIRAPSERAEEWQGWGTALKPAIEPIVLARKPLIGTVAANVVAHGCGALNIDGCRIAGESTVREKSSGPGNFPHEDDSWIPRAVTVGSDIGRWPANLIHDGSDEVVRLFPSEAGALAPVRGDEPSLASVGAITGERARVAGAFHGDTGSAARFYYCAKASREDREEGLDRLAPRILARSSQTQAEAKRGNVEEGEAAGAFNIARARRNHHPTVKPTDLMRYLCRLVTPPGGVVLDPFLGSGSTGKAAALEGFRFVGIELDPEYFEVACGRVKWAAEDMPLQRGLGF